MAVTWIPGVPVDQVTEQARQMRFWRTVATVLAGLLWGVGWLAAKGCALAWLALAWVVVAVRVGWADARAQGRESGGG
ncbi:hypothetical protein [Streptomyces sp. NPDC006333]|uniref:hypothetical protein n=1 Tax=Streptomyces sp. NPDC006333 TaxID=3156753 RepID=UPI0033AF2076